MQAATTYTIIKLALRWFAATGQCIKSKQAAGETIDWWDRLECGISGLSGLESDITPLLDSRDYERVGKVNG